MSDYIKRSDIPYRDLAEGHNTDVKVLVAFASDIAEIPSADVVDKSLYDRAVSGEVELEKAESVSNSQNINHSALKEQIKKYLEKRQRKQRTR